MQELGTTVATAYQKPLSQAMRLRGSTCPGPWWLHELSQGPSGYLLRPRVEPEPARKVMLGDPFRLEVQHVVDIDAGAEAKNHVHQPKACKDVFHPQLARLVRASS